MSVCVSLVFVGCGSLCVTSVALYVDETCFSAIGCSQLVEWREKETVKAWRQLFPTQKHKAGTREVFPFATTCYIAHLTAHCAHVHVKPHQKKNKAGTVSPVELIVFFKEKLHALPGHKRKDTRILVQEELGWRSKRKRQRQEACQ